MSRTGIVEKPLVPARVEYVLFLASSLQSGGAERQLVALARGLHRRGHRVVVAVFYGGGRFEEDLRSDGITVHDLGRRGRWDIGFWPRLARLVQSDRPDAVLAYLGGPNMFAALLKLVDRRMKVVWGVRSAARDLRAYDWLARIAPRIHGVASVLADAVVANSDAARRQAIAEGIAGRKILVIPNGIDCERFRPDADGRERVRREWGVPDRARLVGMVARLDPVKNHGTFLRAAARVRSLSRHDVRFVCVGTGDERYRRSLERMASDLGLATSLTWTGEQAVTRALYSALDVAVLSSDSESFPNVVAEAMACGTPVVATSTGDTPVIVGDTGIVVPPRDPVALGAGIVELLERTDAEGRVERDRIRARIQREFSVDRLVERTEDALERLANGDHLEQA
jgi:glycosyltransferase involved in cell wall biosynthesis